MIRKIKRTTSISNLLTASASGQIATLLTLSMVIVLMVIVATIKVGNLSNKATALANAADSSALLLASQLSTKAYQLWDSLKGNPNDGRGATEKCQKSSFLSLFLAIIFVIVMIVVLAIFCIGCLMFMMTYANGMLMVLACAAAGAIGGAVGAVASGTNVLQGAAQGAAVGAAIGSIGAGVGSGMLYGETTFMSTGFASTYTSGLLSGAIAGIGGGGYGFYKTIKKAQDDAKQLDKSFSQAARALNGLPEKDIYRESVFLNALSQTP